MSMTASRAAMTATVPAKSASTDAGQYTLTRATRVSWGVGTFGPALVMSIFNILTLRFMTDSLAIGAALGGLLIAGAKIVSAMVSPMFGIWSDQSRAKASRRRPFLLIGGLGLACSLVLMFAVPDLATPAATASYMAVAFLVYALAYSAFNIPYMAMPTEMTLNYHERSDLMTWRVLATGAAGMVASGLGLSLLQYFGGGRQGHLTLALIFAPLVFLSSFIAWRGTAGAPFTRCEAVRQRYSIADRMTLLRSNRPFMLLVAVKFVTLMSAGLAAILPFFFTRVLHLPDSVLGIYIIIIQLTLLASQLVVLPACRRFGKKHVAIASYILATLGYLSWGFAGPEDPLWHAYVRAVVLGLAAGGALLAGQALLPDTIEVDYLRSGLRREGLFASVYSIVEKVSQALGVAFVGFFLGAVGYVASASKVTQSASAVEGIQMIVALLPAGVHVVAIVLLFFYDLSERRLQELRAEREAIVA